MSMETRSSDGSTGFEPSEASNDEPRKRRLLAQAEIPPVIDDGIRPFAIGTMLAAVATVILMFAGTRVQPWILYVAEACVVIGLFGTAYCVWRRDKRRRDAALGIKPPTA